MERAVALKKLAKLVGKGFTYEINPRAPTPEERQQAKEASAGLEAAKKAASEALTARKQTLLSGDAEYQRLMAEYKAADKARAENNGKLYSYKFTVGHVSRAGEFGFFHVNVQGDSWEEVIEKLEKEKARV